MSSAEILGEIRCRRNQTDYIYFFKNCHYFVVNFYLINWYLCRSGFLFFVSSSEYFMSHRLMVDSRMSRKCHSCVFLCMVNSSWFCSFYLCVCLRRRKRIEREYFRVCLGIREQFVESILRANPSCFESIHHAEGGGDRMEYYTLSVLRNPFFF